MDRAREPFPPTSSGAPRRVGMDRQPPWAGAVRAGAPRRVGMDRGCVAMDPRSLCAPRRVGMDQQDTRRSPRRYPAPRRPRLLPRPPASSSVRSWRVQHVNPTWIRSSVRRASSVLWTALAATLSMARPDRRQLRAKQSPAGDNTAGRCGRQSPSSPGKRRRRERLVTFRPTSRRLAGPARQLRNRRSRALTPQGYRSWSRRSRSRGSTGR